ncbi:phage tail spike protein [Ligilactobacillus equi]|uniref:phage tail spike protein n=1 Tax=Ligilactobacillus equi TaxID=137357 RepID=UPI000704EC40|nr:phage tail spike protein [Ligilactobacillus equi]
MSYPILYSADETDFFGNGLGTLPDALSVLVTEERNGEFTLSMTYPQEGKRADLLTNNRIIKVDAGHKLKDQRFVIKTVTPKMSDDGYIDLTVYAEHISYITADLAVTPSIVLSGNAESALQQWKGALLGGNPDIVVDSDIETKNETSLDITKATNARQVLGGVAGSILDVWGGEYRFDNLHISLRKQRGTTANTLLSYGRNLLTFEQEQDISQTYTSIYPYAAVSYASGSDHQMVTVDGYIVDSEYLKKYPNRKILPVDFGSEFSDYRIGSKPSDASSDDKTIYTSETEIKKLLKNQAQSYVVNNRIGIPKVSTKISFADLSKTEEYKNVAPLEYVDLCDIVPVRFEKLGIDSEIKVTRIVWNVLLDAYDSIELGDLSTTLGESISAVASETKEVKNNLAQTRILAQTAADGNHTVFRTDGGTTEPTAKKVGDLWFKTDGNDVYMLTWNGTNWEEITNTKDVYRVSREVASLTANVPTKSELSETFRQSESLANSKFDSVKQSASLATSEAYSQAQSVIDSQSTKFDKVWGSLSAKNSEFWSSLEKADSLTLDGLKTTQVDLEQIKRDVDSQSKATSETISQAISGMVSTSAQADKLSRSLSLATSEINSAWQSNSTSLSNLAKGLDSLSTGVKSTTDSLTATYNDQKGKVATLTTDVTGLKGAVKDNEDNINSLSLGAKGMSASISNAQGAINNLQADADGLKQEVTKKVDNTTYQTGISNLNGKIDLKAAKSYVDSELSKKANSAELSVTNEKIEAQASRISSLTTDVEGKITDLQNKTTPQQLIKTVTDSGQANHVVTADSVNQSISGVRTEITKAKDELTGKLTTVETKVQQNTNETKSTKDKTERLISSLGADSNGNFNWANNSKIDTALGSYQTIKKIDGKIDGLQVGGRNLLKGTADITGDVASYEGSINRKIFNGNDGVSTNQAWQGILINMKNALGRADIKSGDTITLSVYVKADKTINTGTLDIYRAFGTVDEAKTSANTGATVYAINMSSKPITTQWQQYSWVFKVQESTLYRMNTRVEYNSTPNTNIYYAGLKLEKGNKPSDWSPAPEDVEGKINGVQSNLTSYKAEVSNTYAKASSVYTKSDANSLIQSRIDQTAGEIKQEVSATLVGAGRNLAEGTSSTWQGMGYTPKGNTNEVVTLVPRINLYNLKVGDTLTVYMQYQYGSAKLVSNTAQTFVPFRLVGNKTRYDKALYGAPSDKVVATNNTTWREVTLQIKVDSEMLSNDYYSANARWDGVSGGWWQWTKFKVERGTNRSDWSPAPEDVAYKSQMLQKPDGWSAVLSDNYGRILSGLALDNSDVRFKGNHIHLDGQTIIDNSIIKSAMIDSIDATKIKAGSIDGQRLRGTVIDGNVANIKNLHATNLFADGLIDGKFLHITGASQLDSAIIKNVHIADGAITNAKIGNLSVDTAKIKDGAITSAKIGSIDAGKITAGTLNAANVRIINLDANNITTGTLKGPNLSLNLMTGAVDFRHGHIQSTSGNFHIDIDNGTIEAFNGIGDGVGIHNGVFELTSKNLFDNNQKPYFKIDNYITSTTGAGSYHGASLQGRDALEIYVGDTEPSDLITASGYGILIDKTFGTRIIGGNTGVTLTAGTAYGDVVKSSPQIAIGAGQRGLTGGSEIHINASYTRITSATNRTTSSSPNLYVGSDGTLLRSTSASKYKTAIVDAHGMENYGEKLINISPKLWVDKAEKARFKEGRNDGYALHYGLIADELDKEGLSKLVRYDSQGEIEGIEYDKIAVALLPLLKKQQNQIAELQEQIEELKGR